MESENWQLKLGQNLSRLRREKGLTQTELGEKLNYSDKTISKWERGEGMPDVNVLIQLAEMFGVTLNDMVGVWEKNEPAREEELLRKQALPRRERIAGHAALLIIMESTIWLAALIVFFVLMLVLPQLGKSWIAFIIALPVSGLSLGVCFLCWRLWIWAMGAMSAAVWTMCLSFQLMTGSQYAGFIYAIGGLIQLTALLVTGVVIYERHRKKHKRAK